MYRIDTEKFNQTLQLLIGYIIGAQEKNHCDNPTKIDFHSGWLCEQEGYKRYYVHLVDISDCHCVFSGRVQR